MLKYNELYFQDCIGGMKLIDDEVANVIMADPPYNAGKDFGNDSDKMEFDEYLNWTDEWLNESMRILRNDGSLFIYGFSEMLAHIFVRINSNKRWLVWHYKNKNSVHDTDWQRSHESIIQVWKKERIFNIDDIRIPYSKSYLENSVGKKRNSTLGRFGNKETVYKAHIGGAKPRDVIEVPSLAGGAGSVERYAYCKTCKDVFLKKELKDIHDNHDIIIHPTQKPMELTEILLKSSINKNEENNLVVIPFSGSGSELIVCKKLNLNYIGFEITEDYVDMSNLLMNKVDLTTDVATNKFFGV